MNSAKKPSNGKNTKELEEIDYPVVDFDELGIPCLDDLDLPEVDLDELGIPYLNDAALPEVDIDEVLAQINSKYKQAAERKTK